MAGSSEEKPKNNPLPKNPPMNFGGGIPSMFSKGKFNPPGQRAVRTGGQSTFHTQHKGGPVGGGK